MNIYFLSSDDHLISQQDVFLIQYTIEIPEIVRFLKRDYIAHKKLEGV